MAIHHLDSGEIAKLALGSALGSSETTALVKTPHLEVIRLVVPAGKKIPPHQAPGEITVQCLEGRVAFEAHGKRQELDAGAFLHLSAGEPHALEGIENASVLVTILLAKS